MPTSNYLFKGCLINCLSDPDRNDELRTRVFNAISRPGFATDLYNLIGLEVGVGLVDLDDMQYFDESVTIKYTIWRLNQHKIMPICLDSFIQGSRFGILTWINRKGEKPESIIKFCNLFFKTSQNTRIGLIVHDQGFNWGPFQIGRLLEDEIGLKVRFNENLDEFMFNLLISSINDEDVLNILYVSELDEIRQPEIVSFPPTRIKAGPVSRFMIEKLKLSGFHLIDDRFLIINEKKYIFNFDLDAVTLYVAPIKCKSCKSFDIRNFDCFAKICIELEKPFKPGYARNVDLEFSDIFFLSIIYSIVNDELPESIRTQFPKKPLCKSY
ncbi:MAG: hypothetical protein ACTSRA_21930 [Promethearchaeota archaeon]